MDSILLAVLLRKIVLCSLIPNLWKSFAGVGPKSRRLATIPIFIIGNYNVSLYGGVIAAQLRDRGFL